MGRQVTAILDDIAETEFLKALKSKGEIKLLQTFVLREQDLFVDEFSPRCQGNWSYYIWNRIFRWQPQIAKTRMDLDDERRRGLFYVSNTNDAPLIEYSRHNFENGNPGRIYWAKYFAAPNGLHYDVAEFEKWYEFVVSQVRKLNK